MRIEAGDVQTPAPTYRNFKNKFELFDVAFDQETAILVPQKIKKNLNF